MYCLKYDKIGLTHDYFSGPGKYVFVCVCLCVCPYTNILNE